jgi:hypothetical protein
MADEGMTLMGSLWHKLRVITGACAANVTVDDMKDYFERGEQVAQLASLVERDADRAARLRQGAEYLGKAGKVLGTAKGVCMDLRAISQMHDAITVLNQPGVIQPGSEAAAAAFGQLFVGAGHFAAKLPPPANAYAQILEGCGSFFLNMQRLLDPERRPNGRQLREVMQSL